MDNNAVQYHAKKWIQRDRIRFLYQDLIQFSDINLENTERRYHVPSTVLYDPLSYPSGSALRKDCNKKHRHSWDKNTFDTGRNYLGKYLISQTCKLKEK